MEEIEVGDYVRTVDGVIANVDYIEKIEYISKHKVEKTYCFDKTIYYEYEDAIYFLLEDELDKYITKHSPNIIDLIEVGDYVNGYKVIDVMEDMQTGELHLEMPMDYTNQEKGDCTIYNKNIKSIVTKEQFQNVQYTIKED